ncbi:MAG: HlyD family efflux transporter periplasmic adaptor subunit, partial [Planctomycetota bacterium]
EARIQQIETEIERSLVRAPRAGVVLQVNLRPGEYVGASAGRDLIVLGDMERPHVRVDIDEHEIPRFLQGAPATAMVRGDLQHSIDLDFVRVEPFVIPKQSLTGQNTERVDTRVLQVIYAIRNVDRSIFVGQQVDVFIRATPITDTTPPTKSEKEKQKH